jgi:hypothetical protein
MKIADYKGESKSGNLIYEYQERFLVKMPLSTNDTLTVKDQADNKAYSFLGSKDIIEALNEIKEEMANDSLLLDEDIDLFEY